MIIQSILGFLSGMLIGMWLSHKGLKISNFRFHLIMVIISITLAILVNWVFFVFGAK